ncbi:MAG TPA: pitrilysin family protein [Candidatus Baltobacteraceae bacterium]|jgi:zinc protease
MFLLAAALSTVLANGMRVVVLPNKLAPVATVVMEYGVGSNDDTIPGLAHATEHMMYRGTSGVSAAQFAEIADRVGAQYNAATENEFTYYYFTLPSSYVGVALHLEADRMTGASMRESEWTTERKAIEQEVRAHESLPGYAIGRKLRTLFYGDSPIAQDTVGSVDSFEKMTAGDILQFYRAWYHPNNATLIVAGDVDPDAVVAQVRGQFDAIPSVTLPARTPFTLAPLAATTVSDSADLPVPIAALMYRTPGANEADHGAVRIIDQVFNSGRTELADLSASGKLLAGGDISTILPEAGFSSLIGIPAPGSSAKDASALIAGVLDGYRTKGLPPDLVAGAKLRLLNDQLYSGASISGLAFLWTNAIGLHRDSPDVAYDAITKATDDDVNRALRTYYSPDHQITALLSPKGFKAAAQVDRNAGSENVRYASIAEQPLPAWASSALAAPLRFPQTGSVTTAHLPNGLTVVVRPESVSSTVVVEGDIQTDASLYEPAGREGVADLTSGLMPWGTTSYDRKAYEAQADTIAANVSLGTSFSLSVASQDFDRGMQLLADGTMHPAFPQSGFDVEKSRTAAVLAAAERLPSSQAAIAEKNALYPPGDPRRRRATVASMETISRGDVERWYAFAYRPDLTTIAIVGDVTPDRAVAVAKKYFGDWKAFGKRPDFQYPKLHQRTAPRETITVKSPSSVQSEVTLKQVVALHKADAQYVPLLLANTMLSGEGTGSLLFRELRTHDGFVYSVDSDVSVDDDGATFSISYASDPKNVDRAQAAAAGVIRRMQNAPLANVELERAKAVLLADRVLPLASYGGIARQLVDDQEYEVTAKQSDLFWKQLQATTPQQVQAAMRTLLRPDHFLRVIVEPGS